MMDGREDRDKRGSRKEALREGGREKTKRESTYVDLFLSAVDLS